MSQIHDGPLATYSSLTDKNLAGYFSNTRMRRHLKKAGLVDRRGQIISENQYRLNMARKEHKKHVKDLLAQAIVHKTLDIERTRQVEIKRKLEEISKLEVVRRVRAQKFRKGDEDILPYLSPRSSRPSSRYRPRSAPADRQYDGYEADVIYVDDEGRPVTPPKDLEDENKREEIDTRHLYALDSAALKKYALTLSKIEQGEGMSSPYLISQVPSPPRSARGSRSNYRDTKYKPRLNRPRTANSLSPYRSTRTGAVQGTLMLHRQEPAMMHQGEVQTLCEVTMKYFGPNLILPRDQRDPTQNVEIEQQHCGGNTLPVFKERIKPGDEFTFISRRHRGYPFSLSIFVEGRISARVSTCCEYGHAKGVRLGGKMGQFCLKSITGATPCYKCKLNAQASPRTSKRPASQRKQKVEKIQEEIIVLRPEKKAQEEEEVDENIEVAVEGTHTDEDDDNIRSHKAYIKTESESDRSDNKTNDNHNSPEEDKYSDDDFEEEDAGKKDSGNEKYEDDFESQEESRKTPEPRRRSRSSSSSSSSSRSRSRTPTPRNEPKEEREIYGLKPEEDVRGKERSDDEKSEKDKPVKIEGLSDEDEQPESRKWTIGEQQKQKNEEKPSRRSSTSSFSSSSSTKSSDSRKRKEQPLKAQRISSPVSTESRQTGRRRSNSSTSSSSSDDQVKKYERHLSEEDRRREDHNESIKRRREEELEREKEFKLKEEKRQIEQEKRRQEEEEDRKKRDELRRQEEERKAEAIRREKAEKQEAARKAYAQRKTQQQFSSVPEMDQIPDAPSYSKMYESEVKAAVVEVERSKTPARVVSGVKTSSSSPETSSESDTKKGPYRVPTPNFNKRSSSSPSSSETETDRSQGGVKVPQRPITPTRVTPPRSRTVSSSSSDSSTDSETDVDKSKSGRGPTPAKVSPPRTPTPTKLTPPRSKNVSSSSSSSGSETETDVDKRPKSVSSVRSKQHQIITSESETTTDTDQKKAKPASIVRPPKQAVTTTTTSESETTTDTDQKQVKAMAVIKTKIEEESESSSSSSSGSETETENDKSKKQPSPPPPPPQPVEAVVKAKTIDSSSSSESETETETGTETETDNEKVKKGPEPTPEKLPSIQEKEKKSSSSRGSSSSSESETETETDRSKTGEVKQETKTEQVKEDKKKEATTTTSDSSGSSDSSTDSSDSEDEDKKRTAEKMKKILKSEEQPREDQTQTVAAPSVVEDKINSDEPFISESEGELKNATTIFDTESDGGHMHGGNDPDNLGSGSQETKSFLTKIGVAPAKPQEGNVAYLIQGKKDIEITNIALNSSQVVEVSEFLSKTDQVSSVCMRNAGIDNEKFGSIADGLKATSAKPLMLNFNLNKITSGSVEKMLEVLVDKPSIEILLLHGNPLGDEGVKLLVYGILDIHKAFNQKEAEEIKADDSETRNGDNKQEVKQRETTHYCVLKEMDLGDTNIGDEGIGHIAHLLENESDLQTLNLNGNTKITYAGWKKLAKALKKNKTLKSLTLDFNKIGDEGIAILVNCLKDNTSLQTLDLESTGLTEEGGIQLIDLVKCNTTILDVTVQPGNRISEKTQDEIRNYLGLNKAAATKIVAPPK